MKLLVIDIETTGLDINSDAIIEIGAALVDTETGEINLVFDKPVKGKYWDSKLHKDAWIFSKSNLTIKDITKPVILNVEYGGTATDPWGNVKTGFELKGKINRKDFGLFWNATIEAGGTMVSEEVTLIANIELLKK